MKKLYAILAFCFCLTISGCSKENTPSNIDASSDRNDYFAVSSTESSGNADIFDPAPNPDPISNPDSISNPNPVPASEFLVGLAGDIIPAENYLTDMNGITQQNFSHCRVAGTYVAMPSGIFRTSRDNPDVFDKENNSFTDVPAENKKEYIRVADGDEICGFKVKSAFSTFDAETANGTYRLKDGSRKTGMELGFPEIYFQSGWLELEGTAEMTGYIGIVAEEVYGVNVGDILFIPTDCQPALPILHFVFSLYDGVIRDVGDCFSDGDIVYTHEYGCGCFGLGNKSTTAADLSGIPDDGSFVRAKVVVDNISMFSSVDWFTTVDGELISVQVM